MTSSTAASETAKGTLPLDPVEAQPLKAAEDETTETAQTNTDYVDESGEKLSRGSEQDLYSSSSIGGKSYCFGHRRPLSERAHQLTAQPSDVAGKKQEQALNSAYGSLQMVRSRLEEMRLIAIRAQDDELPKHVREGLARRFEKIKQEVTILSSDFKTSMAQDNVVIT